MKLACLCPTFRRPLCLANALACYLAQDYPAELRELIILDDAGQYDTQAGPGWRLVASQPRFDSLPQKYNALAALAPDADAYVVWEDDDVFLPWHLSAHAAALAAADWSRPSRVRSTYGQNRRGTIEESGLGRFHGGWAFRAAHFRRIGGYRETTALSFDQQHGQRLSDAGTVGDPCDHAPPSYVFRWGNPYYHGQAHGDDFWNVCGRAGDPTWIGRLAPAMDDETERIYRERRA